MRIHREGYPTIALTGGVFLLVDLIVVATLSRNVAGLVIALSLAGWVLFIQFFRSPARTVPENCDHCVISPTDGVVIAVERVGEKEYFQDERIRVSIYMSILNAHVNRVPVSGTVAYTCYHPGKYLVAYHPKSSELNEHNTVVVTNPQGRQILVRQIAGLLARRIVCYVEPGQPVTVGEELGFIKLGSRCDVYLPLDSEIKVASGQAVRGAESVLAIL